MMDFHAFKPERIGTVILAAGCSSRMGAFKPLLPLGSITVIERTVAAFRQAGFSRLWVVTGYRGEEIEACLAGQGIVCIHNERFQEGMFSSLKSGIQRIDRSLQGFFVMPADMPLVEPGTLLALLAAFERGRGEVVYPVWNGRRGHPPLLSIRLADPILSWNGDGGLRAFLTQYQGRSIEVPATDEGVLLDLDHHEDYLRVVGRYDLCKQENYSRDLPLQENHA